MECSAVSIIYDSMISAFSKYFLYVWQQSIWYEKFAPPCSSTTMSSKQWLVKNGLVAKKLTILDALAPTFIPHKAKYVPIIGKQVNSKVFDDVSIKGIKTSCESFPARTKPFGMQQIQ